MRTKAASISPLGVRRGQGEDSVAVVLCEAPQASRARMGIFAWGLSPVLLMIMLS